MRALLERYDPVHVLGWLIRSEIVFDPETYKETENPGQAYVVELVAAELALRSAADHAPASSYPIEGHLLEPLPRLAREAASFEMWRRFGAIGGPDKDGAARARAATQHLLQRSPGWPWQEYAVLRGLFSPPHMEARLRDRIGIGVEEAIRCCQATSDLLPERLHAHQQAAHSLDDPWGEGHPAYDWAATYLGSKWKEAPPDEQAYFLTGLWAINHMGDAFLIGPQTLSEKADVGTGEAHAYLKALSLPMGQTERDWFAMVDELRRRPFLDFEEHGYLCTVPGNDLFALRPLFEQSLKEEQSYLRHRGRWLGDRCAELLGEALNPDELHVGVKFEFEREDGEQVRGEIDVLIRLGDTVLLVEAKAASMRLGARRGGEAFRRFLKDTLKKATMQGTNAVEAMRLDAALTKNGQALQLGERIQEAHPIMATLDDLSSIAPALWEMEGSRYIPPGSRPPWLINVYELDLICQTVEWPVQLVHFLRRRTRLNQHRRHKAGDELDWWMYYLTSGLYFEHETDTAPTMFTSQTDPLDAWVLYDQGQRTTPAPKPRLRLDGPSRRFLDRLCSERPPGWAAAGCFSLEPNGKARKDLWKEFRRLDKRVRERGRPQRGTFGFGDDPHPELICVVSVPAGEGPALDRTLAEMIAQRLEQHGQQNVLALGRECNSKREYDALAVYAQVWREV